MLDNSKEEQNITVVLLLGGASIAWNPCTQEQQISLGDKVLFIGSLIPYSEPQR